MKKPPRKRKTVRVMDILMLLFLTIGVLLLAYPFVSDALNNFLDQQLITVYQHQANKENQAVVQKVIKKMNEKNAELVKNKAEPGMDQYDQAIRKKEKRKVDKTYYQEHTIAVLEIPKINLSLPIFDETNEYFLQKGTSLLEGTSYPTGGKNTHAVLSGHRGLSTARLFTDLPKLAIGDTFYIEINKQHHAYKVDNIQTIEPTNTEPLKIQANKDLVTLMTCTPYMINTHRLLVRGHRVPYKETNETTKMKRISFIQAHLIYLWGLLGIIGSCLIIWILWHWTILGMWEKRQYALRFSLIDRVGLPLNEVLITVYDSHKKKIITRTQEEISDVTNQNGFIDLGELPGKYYQVKISLSPTHSFFVKIRPKSRTENYFIFRKNRYIRMIGTKDRQLDSPIIQIRRKDKS
ncbi:sortase [Enterococcus durans]|uniref:class C sortase n=1 Tax=Enterococcus durans TaxID=53345 RepID=UPI000DF89222|nr:class C sortase [Enterococcus durans]MDB1685679.1 class C sortase [Enterococcus durans]STP37700.1 sortase [Enterococcus durans]HCB28564.1 class C sortase [Enterococcus sp.]